MSPSPSNLRTQALESLKFANERASELIEQANRLETALAVGVSYTELSAMTDIGEDRLSGQVFTMCGQESWLEGNVGLLIGWTKQDYEIVRSELERERRRQAYSNSNLPLEIPEHLRWDMETERTAEEKIYNLYLQLKDIISEEPFSPEALTLLTGIGHMESRPLLKKMEEMKLVGCAREKDPNLDPLMYVLA